MATKEPEVTDDFKETVSPRHNSIDAYMNSLRMWQQAHGLYRFKPVWVPELRWGSGFVLPLLTRELFLVDTG